MIRALLLSILLSAGAEVNVPDYSMCGKAESKASLPPNSSPSQIIAMTNPWNAAVYYKDSTDVRYLCGGTIISPEHILTSGTFIQSPLYRVDQIKVAVGAVDYSWESESENKQVFDVERLMAHPEFFDSSGNFSNDVGVIKLKGKISFNKFVRPVCIYKEADMEPNLPGTLVGWVSRVARSNEYSSNEDELKESQIPLISKSECRSETEDKFQRLITPDKFCGKSEQLNGRRIWGSGYIIKVNGVAHLAGVASVFDENVITFTNITNFVPWLSQV